MNIYLVGVGCIGKSTIGKKLAGKLRFQFVDLDREIENFYSLSIERIQNHMSISEYRKAGARVLKHIISQTQNQSRIIALPPSGLTAPYRKVIYTDITSQNWTSDI